MSQVISIRLRNAQSERLGRLARRLGRSPGETGALLIEEALRMSEYALIDFRDSVVGRQAYMQGSSLAVWEVMMIVRAYNGDAESAAKHLQWPIQRIHAAVNYAAAYPGEIDTAITDNEAYDAERVSRMLPGTRVLTMIDGKLVEEALPRATAIRCQSPSALSRASRASA